MLIKELEYGASYKEIIDKINEIVRWIWGHTDAEIAFLKTECRGMEISVKTEEAILQCLNLGGSDVIS